MIAAHEASKATGVPYTVLAAISLTETGHQKNRRLETWPWTINVGGKGVWFDSKKDAISNALRYYQEGARSFDIGCFQINYKWHGHAFSSVEEMFDPRKNATYAAGFLKDLYEEFGDWSKAAGAYHSRTPRFAEIYRKRFDVYHARVLSNAVAAPTQKHDLADTDGPKPLINLPRQSFALGSLVPTSPSSTATAPFIQ
ncbi:transglycosylase SLT domain-containing protein [Pseudaestuariivita rosea]|uniref:transglycosylase SLT domain-containing protein n=1 Tax=Pseudaestuariivita rosea TaxID=2763263 RepID=UPI001ABB3075|nr:transglycosylase SLT domain-containing protein [Pseudaestuariivita rosea]